MPGTRFDILETELVLIFLLLFIGLPLIEIYFLIEVGSEIGALPTIGLSILTAVIGTWLVRHQGFGVLIRVRELQARDEVPAFELVDGALILVAGLFLLLPGFLTDTVGFLLLVPALRHALIHRLVRIAPVSGSSGPGDDRRPRVIEGVYRRDPD